MAHFDPERMAVYRLAREHTRAIRVLLEASKSRGYADLVDQTRRAAASITANILEAGGEWTPRKRAHYFRIAKGSTWECWAHTDTLVDFQLVPEGEIARARDLQRQITALLLTSIHNAQNPVARDPTKI
jgi:four helix bundle protein